MKKQVLSFLFLFGLLSCVFASQIALETCVEHTSIGFSFANEKIDYEVKVSTGCPNIGIIMKQQDNWQFKYNTAVNPGGPVYFDALRFYNGLEFIPRMVITDFDFFKLKAGLSLFCEYYNGYRIRSDFKTVNIGLKVSVKPEFKIADRLSVFGNIDIPMCQIAISENRSVNFSSFVTDTGILEKIKYKASIGLALTCKGK